MAKRKVQKARAAAKRANKRERKEKLRQTSLAEASRRMLDWLIRPRGRFTP